MYMKKRTAGFKEAVKKNSWAGICDYWKLGLSETSKKELEKSEKKTAFLCTGDMFALKSYTYV